VTLDGLLMACREHGRRRFTFRVLSFAWTCGEAGCKTRFHVAPAKGRGWRVRTSGTPVLLPEE